MTDSHRKPVPDQVLAECSDGLPEDVLAGGNMEPVVRVGETVRRVAGPWTDAVHELLRACERACIAETPRALGLDESGREMLTFLPGDVMADLPAQPQWSPSLLREAGVLLRRIHDASVDLAETPLAWRQPSREPVEVICHNDFAPYNLIVRDGRLAGVIDCDMASPGPRLWDLAYLAYRIVPFAEDATGFDPERDGSRGERLAALIAAYEMAYAPADVVATAARRLEDLAAFTDARAAETGRDDLAEHAAMYRRDAARLQA